MPDINAEVTAGPGWSATTQAIRDWYREPVPASQRVEWSEIQRLLMKEGPGTNGMHAYHEIRANRASCPFCEYVMVLVEEAKFTDIDTTDEDVERIWNGLRDNTLVEDFTEATKTKVMELSQVQVPRWKTYGHKGLPAPDIIDEARP